MNLFILFLCFISKIFYWLYVADEAGNFGLLWICFALVVKVHICKLK